MGEDDEVMVSNFSCIDRHVCHGGSCTDCENYNACDACENQFTDFCDDCPHNY